jgi:predicted ATP-binding protein involved in virulence
MAHIAYIYIKDFPSEEYIKIYPHNYVSELLKISNQGFNFDDNFRFEVTDKNVISSIKVTKNYSLNNQNTTCIVGKNGAGKSTLLNIMLQLLFKNNSLFQGFHNDIDENLVLIFKDCDNNYIIYSPTNPTFVNADDSFSYKYIGTATNNPNKYTELFKDTIVSYYSNNLQYDKGKFYPFSLNYSYNHNNNFFYNISTNYLLEEQPDYSFYNRGFKIQNKLISYQNQEDFNIVHYILNNASTNTEFVNYSLLNSFLNINISEHLINKLPNYSSIDQRHLYIKCKLPKYNFSIKSALENVPNFLKALYFASLYSLLDTIDAFSKQNKYTLFSIYEPYTTSKMEDVLSLEDDKKINSQADGDIMIFKENYPDWNKPISKNLYDFPKENDDYDKLLRYDQFADNIIKQINEDNRCTELINSLNKLIEQKNLLILLWTNSSKNVLQTYITHKLEPNSDLLDLINLNYNMKNIKPILQYEFRNISSGESSLLTLFSRLYALKIPTGTKEIILFLDEPEVYFHPEWQRKFYYFLTEFLSKTNKFSSKNIQIILTSNSPYILSDMMSNNIIMLNNSNPKNLKVVLKSNNFTFGANIHTLLKDSFFMSDTIGEFAKQKIKAVTKDLIEKSAEEIGEEGDRKKEIKFIIDNVGEPIIQRKLQELYNKKFNRDKKSYEDEIAELKDKLSKAEQSPNSEDIDDIDNIIKKLQSKVDKMKENINNNN